MVGSPGLRNRYLIHVPNGIVKTECQLHAEIQPTTHGFGGISDPYRSRKSTRCSVWNWFLHSTKNRSLDFQDQFTKG